MMPGQAGEKIGGRTLSTGSIRRPALPLLALALLLPAALPGYNRFARMRLAAEAERGPRSADSGVLIGAEPVTLEGGSGSAVLLIHGFAGSRRDFNDLGEALQAAGHTVRMTRLPGHGTDPEDFARVSPEALLAHVRAERRALAAEHDRVDLVGFSMGGALATILAAEPPEGEAISDPSRMGRLVLVAPYYGVTHHWYYGLRPATWHRILGPFVPYAVKSDYFVKLNRREHAEALLTYRVVPSRGIDAALELGARAADPATLSAVRGPVLVLHAAGDEAADPEASRRALDGMTQAASRRFVSYEHSNHILLWDYDAEAAKDEIIAFLAR